MFETSEMNDQNLSQIMFFTDGNNNLYQLSVQVSQQFQQIQNQQGVSVKSLQDITQELQKKHQNINIQQIDTCSIHVTKKIRKIKEFKDVNLNKKFKKEKIQLNRLWALPLFHFLKGKFNKPSNLKKINRFKKQMITAYNLKKLSKVFQQNLWIGKILQTQKQNLLISINGQIISNQNKALLFQTIDILLEGTKHPENLDSWDPQLNRNIKQSKQLLLNFQDKNYQEIHELAVLQYQKQKEHYQGNKCSTHNNISYFWFKYLKDIVQSEDFKSLYQSHQIYRRLQFTFSQSATIMNIRNLLSIKQLASYILKTKIESKQILSQLMLNSKINLLNKINMVMTLNQFINAIKNPSALCKWIE